MMEFSIINSIALLAVFQSVLLALYLFTLRGNKAHYNYFMAIFLLLFAINTAHDFLDYLLAPFSESLYLFILLSFYMMPASLYLYTKSSLDPRFKLNWKHSIHLLPFLLINLFILPNIYMKLWNQNYEETAFHNNLNIALYVLLYLLILLYQILSFLWLNRVKQLYVENYSNTDTRRFRYLYQLNVLFSILMVFSLIKNFMVYNVEGVFLDVAIYSVKLSLLIFFCWIVLKALNTPELFRNKDPQLQSVKQLLTDTTAQPSGSSIEAKINLDADPMIDRVLSYMEKEEPFLDASLSLRDLATDMKIGSRELSILINHRLDKHFFDFVNEFRIKKAMHFLSSPEKANHTVLEILYEVGFNSKSSFNTAFKKYTHVTPTEYRKQSIGSRSKI